jgi:hypothetical protein
MYEPPAEKYWCRMGVLTGDFITGVFVCVCVFIDAHKRTRRICEN